MKNNPQITIEEVKRMNETGFALTQEELVKTFKALGGLCIKQSEEIKVLKKILSYISANAPLADGTCKYPGITLAEAASKTLGIDNPLNTSSNLLDKNKPIPRFYKVPKTIVITEAALTAGFSISTAYGQGKNKLMPISDFATLKAFAEKILSNQDEGTR